MKVFIRLAFYGRDYYGTQKQKTFPTVQSAFETALSNVYQTPIKTTISSRLDRGVNALDFALSFEAPDSRISLTRLSYYLRRTLGQDIFLRDLREVPEDFSARYSCDYKRYLYLIQNGEEKNPLLNPLTYSPLHPLPEEKLSKALSLFEGTHDFRSFATPEKEDENTVLTLDQVTMKKKDNLLYLRFQGRNFLRYQVRFLVGAALRYATDGVSEETLEALLRGEKRKWPKLKAEPQGLTLEGIHYPLFDGPLAEKDPLSSLLG
jgi:tRNA pseudouridine38-40 synthase